MTGDPRVSAIITTYKRPDVLARAIRSVLRQTVSDVEVIVVDDEPSPAAAEVVQGIADERVRYLAHDQNRGLSAARNTGIAAARAPFVAFLDDDDEWAPTKLERQLDVASRHGGRAVVTSYEAWTRPDGKVVERDIALDGRVLRRLLRDDVVHMQTLLVPTVAFEEVGGFDEALFHHEDLDMALRLARVFPFATVREPLTIVYVTPGSLSRNTANRIRALQRVIGKHPELRDDPKLRSRWLYRLARLHAEVGDEPAWKATLRAAVRADRMNIRAVVTLGASRWITPDLHHRAAALRGRSTQRARRLRSALPRRR